MSNEECTTSTATEFNKWKQWETVVGEVPSHCTARLRVPGGWLYRSRYVGRETMVFVPYCIVLGAGDQ